MNLNSCLIYLVGHCPVKALLTHPLSPMLQGGGLHQSGRQWRQLQKALSGGQR